MNYKELLDRYKKGLANEEEKNLVEGELEKKLALEEYISERLDEGIFGEDLDPVEEKVYFKGQEEESRKLKRSVNKRLRRVVASSVVAVILLYFAVFHLLSGLVDLAYYNPTNINHSQEGDYKQPDFYYDMQAYISLNIPGKTLGGFTTENPEGFGKYQVSYFMKDLFTDKEERYFADIKRGEALSQLDGVFAWENRFGPWEAFRHIQFPAPEEEDEEIRDSFTDMQNQRTISYLNQLNPLSYISMSLVFDRDLNMSEFMEMRDSQESLDYKWLGIRTSKPGTRWSENQPMHLIGFNPNGNDESSNSYQKPDFEKFPYFYLEDMWESSLFTEKGPVEGMAKAYELHFKSRLEYLSQREDFIKMFDYNVYKIDFYEETLEYIQENGVKTYGALVYGRTSDFLELIDEIPYESIYINEALPIKPNIYYD